jgi:hypothetical protein
MASQGKGQQGIGGSIYTKRQQKKMNRRDGGGKQMKRRATYATVTDMEFGRKPAPAGCLPQFAVPLPRTKREKYRLGSPNKKSVWAYQALALISEGFFMPEQTNVERIRLEQFEALKCIQESTKSLIDKLIGSGDTIKPDVEELARIANYLAEHT